MLVHIIADYDHGDLAFAEVGQRIKSTDRPGCDPRRAAEAAREHHAPEA